MGRQAAAASPVTSPPARRARLAPLSHDPRARLAAPDATRPPQGGTPLLHAARYGHVATVEALVGLGAAIDAKEVSWGRLGFRAEGRASRWREKRWEGRCEVVAPRGGCDGRC